MAWTRRFHVTCDGCGRMWLDGALTKGTAEEHALAGGWTADVHPTSGSARHWCSSCTPPDTTSGRAA